MGKPYSKEEISKVRKLSKTKTAAQVGEMLGRSVISIQQIAFKHKIGFGEKCQRRYTAKDLSNILRCKAEGMTYRQVAEATGVNYYSCMYLHRRYG
ncbi:hypothetical protein PZBJ_20275 [Pantoea endophytica]|uniref:Uncharacterized protein n=1 Tax=Pantoea endophytica TaxID=92488 RepID=A0ABX4SL36_9GAMM|nr:hypothetical protein [Pantoea endophytica]PLR20392.1 hypothetical protein PZBJ_20275 [Pantoea endophytica]